MALTGSHRHTLATTRTWERLFLLCAWAEAGQILTPVVVRELAAGKQLMFADLGETELRGFEDPVRLYELRWREAG